MVSKSRRGPGYPALGLDAAISRARAVYDRYGKRAASADEIVNVWGYKGLSGPSSRVLAALRQYGILEGGNDSTRLTADALSVVLESEDSVERLASLRRMASRPAVFQKLSEAFKGEELPSDGAMKNYLIKNTAFSGEAADVVVEAFRRTFDLAKLGSKEVDLTKGQGDSLTDSIQQEDDERGIGRKPSGDPRMDTGRWQMQFRWTLPGATTATFVISGTRPDQETVDLLNDYLELAKRSIRREVNMGVTNAEN